MSYNFLASPKVELYKKKEDKSKIKVYEHIYGLSRNYKTTISVEDKAQ